MYSLVLMTCMTATPDAAQFGGLFGRGESCYGCSGYSCTGSCSGTVAYNCCGGGCCGGGFLGFGLGTRVRSFFSRITFHGCSGCCGGCTGAGYGCCGGSSYSCSGGCYGGGSMSYAPVYGCYGGMPLPAVPVPMDYPPGGTIPPATVPTIPYAQPVPAGPTAAAPRVQELRAVNAVTTAAGTSSTARGVVIVRLPADAKLFAEGRELTLTSGERRFVTPELPAGQEYTYRFRAEYDRDGETISVTRKVTVRAGGTATLEFADLTARAAAPAPVAATPTSAPKPEPTAAPAPPAAPAPAPAGDTRATILVRLPAGATLFVDEKKHPSADAVRQFNTPPLPNGKEFSYTMRAEVVRNGQPESMTQKVPFRAGEKITVDFTGLTTTPVAAR